MGELEARAVELRERAAALAAPIHTAARAVTTVACERAMLRLFGVSGLDAHGRPLALEVVDRFAELGPARLGGGIALPFAAASREYDLAPQELAMEVAAGHVDLGLEAELLREPAVRAAAEDRVSSWLRGAWQRFDANRTARRELRSLLGGSGETLLGTDLLEPEAGKAALAAAALVAAGADLLRVEVPRDRELRRGLGEELEPPETSGDPRRAPAGSQRGLALLRAALDTAGAEQGRYVRLASRSLGLAAPDQAVVAGFERVDLVFGDPLEPIVELGVRPERAFADHVFALALHARSGADLVLGAGPLAVAPEMARGVPIAAATRAGRALALQALAAELTLQAPIPPERVILSALPDALRGERSSAEHAVAELALRRLVFREHRLALIEGANDDPLGWPIHLQGWILGGSAPALVIRQPLTAGSEATAPLRAARAALENAGRLGEAREIGGLRGAALEHARAALAEAIATLRTVATDGWDWLLELGPAVRPVGAAEPVARRDSLDPFAPRPVLG